MWSSQTYCLKWILDELNMCMLKREYILIQPQNYS